MSESNNTLKNSSITSGDNVSFWIDSTPIISINQIFKPKYLLLAKLSAESHAVPCDEIEKNSY